MGELLIWLIVLGAAAVVAVYVYNRMEEARFRKRTESAFAPQDGDPLMDGELPRAAPGERIEPQLQGDASADAAAAAGRREPRAIAEPAAAPAPRPAPVPWPVAAVEALKSPAPSPRPTPEPRQPQAAIAAEAAGARRPPLPQRHAAEVAPTAIDSGAIDYSVEIYAGEAVPAAALEQLLRAVGPLAARLRLEGRPHADAPWTPLDRAGYGSCPHVRASLQLVDRRGVIGKQDLILFQSAAARCAASLAASASIPEAEPYFARARELDAFCAEVDVAVGINIIAPPGRPFLGTRLRGLAEAAGLRLADGAFVFADAHGRARFSLENQEQARLLGEALRNLQTTGVTLVLDVPRLGDGLAAFDEMVGVGRKLALSLGGTLVDDNSVPVTDAGLEQIRAQLRGIYAGMQARGIPAGSPAALRLFS
ncbi:MAG TPA: cell division protein ZipA C-terminal FtsZ-binding domain-containing protein [Burkholderiales bacterium]|nr:cell division protein ZipA C-terminal FtsZ-binding domain-containing protein [Burkholderiales bacterium]